MKKIGYVFFALFAGQLLACQQESAEKDTIVTISSEYGEMIAILYDETPKHKQNFIKLAKEKYFDGTLFHRVIKDFMIQGGDPDSKKVKVGEKLGNGGPGYSIPAEISTKYFHEKGSLSAARLPDDQNPNKESSGSQFYIVQGHKAMDYEIEQLKIDRPKLNQNFRKFLSDPSNKALNDTIRQLVTDRNWEGLQDLETELVPRVEKALGVSLRRDVPAEVIKTYREQGGAPHLDGEYTVFGKVIKGLQIIDKIAIVPTDESDRPLKDIPIKITVEEMPKSKITRLYGYQYPTK